MTEGTYNSDLSAELRRLFGVQAAVIKHCDRFTTGVPDLSVSLKRPAPPITFWIECKVLKQGEVNRPRDFVDNVVQLVTTDNCQGYYLVWHEKKDEFAILEAKEVSRAYGLETIARVTERGGGRGYTAMYKLLLERAKSYVAE